MTLRPLLLSIASLALLAATGCRAITGNSSCHKQQAYEAAGDLPPLRVPAGLTGPDTAGALAIPEVNHPELPPDPDGHCLDAPPALIEPPPPPSEVVLPDPRARSGRAADDEARPSAQGEEEPSQRRRRPPRRPR